MAFVNNIFVIIAALACFGLTQVAAQNYCYQQKCHECELFEQDKKGESIKCDFKSQVGIAWLGEVAYPNLNLTGDVSTEHSCIKMVATKKTTDLNGDSTDIIKGCIFKNMAQSVCKQLIELEAARGKQATCVVCDGDECNGSMTTTGSLIMIFVTALLAKIFNY